MPPPAAVQLWPCGCWLTIDDRCPQPYLAAEYVAHFVSGMQGDEADPLYDGKWAKAIATCKHYGATTPTALMPCVLLLLALDAVRVATTFSALLL